MPLAEAEERADLLGSAFRNPDRLAWFMPTTNVSGPNPDAARNASRSSGGLNRSVGMPCGM